MTLLIGKCSILFEEKAEIKRASDCVVAGLVSEYATCYDDETQLRKSVCLTICSRT